jgi:hypothetical protein
MPQFSLASMIFLKLHVKTSSYMKFLSLSSSMIYPFFSIISSKSLEGSLNYRMDGLVNTLSSFFLRELAGCSSLLLQPVFLLGIDHGTRTTAFPQF